MFIRDDDKIYNTANIISIEKYTNQIILEYTHEVKFIEFCSERRCSDVFNKLNMAIARGESFFNTRGFL